MFRRNINGMAIVAIRPFRGKTSDGTLHYVVEDDELLNWPKLRIACFAKRSNGAAEPWDIERNADNVTCMTCLGELFGEKVPQT